MSIKEIIKGYTSFYVFSLASLPLNTAPHMFIFPSSSSPYLPFLSHSPSHSLLLMSYDLPLTPTSIPPNFTQRPASQPASQTPIRLFSFPTPNFDPPPAVLSLHGASNESDDTCLVLKVYLSPWSALRGGERKSVPECVAAVRRVWRVRQACRRGTDGGKVCGE